MTRAPASKRPAARRPSSRKRATASATVDEYRTLEAIAAQATAAAHAQPGANTYRTAAAAHRVAAHAAERASLTGVANGHDRAAQEHDEIAETLAAAWRAQIRRTVPDLERDVQRLLAQEAKRVRR